MQSQQQALHMAEKQAPKYDLAAAKENARQLMPTDPDAPMTNLIYCKGADVNASFAHQVCKPNRKIPMTFSEQTLQIFKPAYLTPDYALLDGLLESAWQLAVKQGALASFVDANLDHVTIVFNTGLQTSDPCGGYVYMIIALSRHDLSIFRAKHSIAMAPEQSGQPFEGRRSMIAQAMLLNDNSVAGICHRPYVLHALATRTTKLNCCTPEDLPAPPNYNHADIVANSEFRDIFTLDTARLFALPPHVDHTLKITNALVDQSIDFARFNRSFTMPFYWRGERGTTILVVPDSNQAFMNQPHAVLLIINENKARFISISDAFAGTLVFGLPRSFIPVINEEAS